MKINGEHYRTIWVKETDAKVIQIIDQRYLPHKFVIEDLKSVDEVVTSIKDMHDRGAGLIGSTAGYGMYLAAFEAAKELSFDGYLSRASEKLLTSIPTVVNLSWAVEMQLATI